MNLRPFFRQLLEALCYRETKKIRVESEGIEPQPQKRFKSRRTGTRGVRVAFGKQPCGYWNR